MPRIKPKQELWEGSQHNLECVRFIVNSYGNGGLCKAPAKRRDNGRGLLFCDECWETVEGILTDQFSSATTRRLAIATQW